MRPADAVYIGFIAGFMTAWEILPAVGKLLKKWKRRSSNGKGN